MQARYSSVPLSRVSCSADVSDRQGVVCIGSLRVLLGRLDVVVHQGSHH
jgi:hypothetical protein